jgi:hypothetical protein
VSVASGKKNSSSYWGGCIGSLATFLLHSLAARDAAELEVRLEVTVLIQGSPTTWYCEWSAIGFYFLRLVTMVVVGCGDGSYTPNKPLGRSSSVFGLILWPNLTICPGYTWRC